MAASSSTIRILTEQTLAFAPPVRGSVTVRLEGQYRKIKSELPRGCTARILRTLRQERAACFPASPPSTVRLCQASPHIVWQHVTIQRAALMARRRVTETEADDLPRYFVWVRGLEGPEPQKWMAMDFGVGDWKRPLVLAYLELPEGERHLPLSALARRYPPPRAEAS